MTEDILHKVSKPARYSGGEWNSVAKDWSATEVKVALAYPDIYEIGMSNLGLAILYDILNERSDVLAERVYAPWVDMEAEMCRSSIPLFSLETRHSIKDFDIVGFSLAHELTYTNVLNMLDLAHIPVIASDRDESHPLVIAGGVCSLNPEPMADFIDAFVMGDGEETVIELIEFVLDAKRSGAVLNRTDMLMKMAQIPGLYVPSLYKDGYKDDRTPDLLEPVSDGAPTTIKRRISRSLPPVTTDPVVPYIQVVHDRAVIEIQRGCTQGCRFCQAGIIYRPLRQRTRDEILGASTELIDKCGYDELSLLSLSTSDYPGIDKLVVGLMKRLDGRRVSISLPSLRLDTFSVELADALKRRKKTGFTFAPEAGSRRLRNVINKHLSDEMLMETIQVTLDKGWTNLKLYFMIGLPTETLQDIEAIVDMVRSICKLRSVNGKHLQVKVNVSTFVPKPHTPFQWVGQDDEQQLGEKHDVLKRGLKKTGAQLSWHDPKSSLLEALMSRGDRRVGGAVYRAWQLGCSFDSWSEHFDFEKWQRAFNECDIDAGFYVHRQRRFDEVLPWSHIDVGVSVDFLRREYDQAMTGKETEACHRSSCSACGLEKWDDACRKKGETNVVD
ncbi:TIGR03960 family B12-binding radical SAM protein [Chloroflexota bacterium]